MVIRARKPKRKEKSAVRPEYRTLSDGVLDLAYFAGELLPNPDKILVSLGGDLRNYAKLLRDDQVHSLLQQRQDALIAAEWEVVPGGEDARDEEAADFLREQLSALSWDAITRKMHKGLLYGYSVGECIWGQDGNRITLQDIRVRKPWRFGFGKNGELKLRVMADVTLMPDRKFWVATWGADDDDNRYGVGLGYHLWWPCYLKRNGAKFWAAYLDKFGTPSTKATYPNGATEKEKETALRAARALRSESAVAMPEGFDIQILEASHTGTASYAEFLTYWDDAIAKVILGQTGTTKQGQYAGTGDVLEGVKAEMIKADADLLCESFNSGPAVWLTEWNFPGANPPQVWRKVMNARKTQAEAERDKAAYGLGLELSDEEIARRYGDAWQRRGGTSPSAPATPSFAESLTAGGAARAPLEARGEGETDSLRFASVTGSEREEDDEPGSLVNQLAEVADRPVLGMVEAIRRELDETLASGGSFAEFSARLSDLYPILDTAELVEALEGAFLAANLAGRADAKGS